MKTEGPYDWFKATGVYLDCLILGLKPRMYSTVNGWFVEYKNIF